MLYLKLPGILGPVKSKGHVGWIGLEAIRFSHGSPRRPDRRVEPEDWPEFDVSRRPDRVSRDIAAAFVQGRLFGEAALEAISVDKMERIGVRYTMNRMQIKSYSMSGDDGDHLETLSLRFDAYRMKSIGGAGPA
jgi:type VI protein secretion system component Hcp